MEREGHVACLVSHCWHAHCWPYHATAVIKMIWLMLQERESGARACLLGTVDPGSLCIAKDTGCLRLPEPGTPISGKAKEEPEW